MLAFFRLNFSTAFSSNAVSVCISSGLTKVKRLEVSTRYLIHWEQDGLVISPGVEEEVCKYICCILTTIEMKKPLLSKE
jgi:phosphoribosylformylglycinamidine synthase